MTEMPTSTVDDVLTAALSAALIVVFLARCIRGRGPRACALGHGAVAAAMAAMAVAPLLPHPVNAAGLPVAAAGCAGLAGYFAVRTWRLRGDVVERAETRRLVVACLAMATLLLIGHGGLDTISGGGALLVAALALVGVGYFIVGACAGGPPSVSRPDKACLAVMNGLMAAMCLMVP